MFTLDKLPAPVQALLTDVPAISLIRLLGLVQPYAKKPIEEVPVQIVTEIVQALEIEDGPQAIRDLTSHMSAAPKEPLDKWFERAAADGTIEKVMTRKASNSILHRCYFCGQPNDIPLPA